MPSRYIPQPLVIVTPPPTFRHGPHPTPSGMRFLEPRSSRASPPPSNCPYDFYQVSFLGFFSQHEHSIKPSAVFCLMASKAILFVATMKSAA